MLAVCIISGVTLAIAFAHFLSWRRDRVRTAIEAYIDVTQWNNDVQRMEVERQEVRNQLQKC